MEVGFLTRRLPGFFRITRPAGPARNCQWRPAEAHGSYRYPNPPYNPNTPRDFSFRTSVTVPDHLTWALRNPADAHGGSRKLKSGQPALESEYRIEI